MVWTLFNEKNLLRNYIAKCLAELSPSEKIKESQIVCQELLKNIPTPSVVFGYYPLEQEVDIRPLLQRLLSRKGQVFLPCVEENKLVFREVKDLHNLCEGKLGNQEPLPSAPSLSRDKAGIVFVPGRAFDRSGYRLGRGGGMYDRFLREHRAQNPGSLIVGLAFNCQLVESIPLELHDEPVDVVVAAQRLEQEDLHALLEQHRLKYR